MFDLEIKKFGWITIKIKDGLRWAEEEEEEEVGTFVSDYIQNVILLSLPKAAWNVAKYEASLLA